MNKREFIAKLRAELSKLPAEEVDAAIEYYEEYFDEAGPEREAEVIRELGSPKKVASQIKSEYAVKMLDQEKRPTAKKGLSAIWWILIGICSAPISIPLAIFLVAAVIGCLAIGVSVLIGLFVSVIGFGAAAIGSLVLGVLALPAAISTAVMFIGLGLAGLGVMAALSVAVVLGVRAAITALVRFVRRKNERRRAEKMARVGGQNQWKYQERREAKKGWKFEDDRKQQASWRPARPQEAHSEEQQPQPRPQETWPEEQPEQQECASQPEEQPEAAAEEAEQNGENSENSKNGKKEEEVK